MKYVPTFQEYQQYHSNEFDENGNWTGTPEDRWNALSDEEKFNSIGGVLGIDPGDPRYDELRQLVPGEEGRSIIVSLRLPSREGLSMPDSVYHGDGFYAYGVENATPELQASWNDNSLTPFLLPLLFTGAGLGNQAGLFGDLFGGASSAADFTIPSMLEHVVVPPVGALDVAGLDSAMADLGLEGTTDFLTSLGLNPMEGLVEPEINMMNLEPTLDPLAMSAGPSAAPWYDRFLSNLGRLPMNGLTSLLGQRPQSGPSASAGAAKSNGLGGPQLSRGNPRGDVNEHALTKVKKPGPISEYLRRE